MYVTELERRRDICDRLRAEVGARAKAKGDREREIFGVVDSLKKEVDRKLKI